MEQQPELVHFLNSELALQLPEKISGDELKEKLAVHINDLINYDFQKLVFLLYRIDVDETKMRKLLAQKDGENAAGLIAGLIIERQLQKIESRKKTGGTQNIADDEKW